MEITDSPIPTPQQPNQFIFFEEKSLVSFDIICEELAKQFNCTYVSYALEMDDGKRIHYYSNRQWQGAFIKERLIENCPLLKFAREVNGNMLEWNSLSGFLNKQQKYVMDARKSFNIGNGIGAKHVVYGMTEMTTFASSADNHEFYRIFIQNIKSFKKYVSALRTLAIASMVISGWLHPSKINFNLKNISHGNPNNSHSVH